MRITLLATMFVALCQLSGQHVLAENFTPSYTGTVYGDLDLDSINEMVVRYVFAEPVTIDVDPEVLAQAVVYRREGGQWREWPAARGPILYAYDEVGLSRMYVRIERGVFVIEHYKSGYFSLAHTRRFRWQNERFELIGATVSNHGRCEYANVLDYNLSTGRFTYKENETSCDDDQEDQNVFSYAGRSKSPAPLLLTDFDHYTHFLKIPERGEQYF